MCGFVETGYFDLVKLLFWLGPALLFFKAWGIDGRWENEFFSWLSKPLWIWKNFTWMRQIWGVSLVFAIVVSAVDWPLMLSCI